MKPAIQFPIKQSVKFIRGEIEANLLNPKKDLEKYIEKKADIITKALKEQNESKIVNLSQKKMKALEELGKIGTVDDLIKLVGLSEFMRLAQDKNLLQNFKG